MGQQQLLLVVLGVIVVGLAVTIGIFIFRQNAIDQKRDLVMNECNSIASLALKYFKKPTTYGGGGGTSFQGFIVPESLAVTSSGSYMATSFEDSVIIIGTGNDVVSGTDSIKIRTVLSTVDFIPRSKIIN